VSITVDAASDLSAQDDSFTTDEDVELTGSVALTMPIILGIALLLTAVNIGLMLVGVALFDRESILTRWK